MSTFLLFETTTGKREYVCPEPTFEGARRWIAGVVGIDQDASPDKGDVIRMEIPGEVWHFEHGERRFEVEHLVEAGDGDPGEPDHCPKCGSQAIASMTSADGDWGCLDCDAKFFADDPDERPEAGDMSTSDGLGGSGMGGAPDVSDLLIEAGWDEAAVRTMSAHQQNLIYEAEGDYSHEQASGERKLWEHEWEATESGTVQAGFEAAKKIAAFLAEPGDWNGGDVCDVAASALIKAGLLTKEQCNN